ncbi:MAG TPA: HD domain-containing protein [Candidatus Nitrosopolaris sp.]
MKWMLNEFAKSGFAKLLKPFENSIDDVVKITRAFGIATKAHTGQFRDGNNTEPYINHPLRVALILTEEIQIHDADLVCTALLHDIIEKSNGSIDEDQLKNDFGEHVYNMVHAVTRPKIKNEVREKVLDEYFHNIATGSRFIRYIKLADRLDNIRALKNALHKDKLMRYKEETQKYILPIAEKTDEKIVFKLSVALYELK